MQADNLTEDIWAYYTGISSKSQFDFTEYNDIH